jgi:sodium-dependent dicarboxylate transporter 2/3/5
MNQPTDVLTKSLYSLKRNAPRIGLILLAAILPFFLLDSPVASRVVAIASVCIVLWLLDVVPPFVPTLLLWVLVPVVLSPFDAKYSLVNTLRWAADPVLALFFGGFALGAATGRQGLDKRLAAWAFSSSRSSFALMLLTTIGATAFMSMWISNIAAAALMFAALRPLLSELESGDLARRTLLVGIALGANLGGIATPIGTGPNGIAMSFISDRHHITFVDWMVFALPLTVLLIGLGYVLLLGRARTSGRINWHLNTKLFSADEPRLRGGQLGLIAVLGVSVVLWLSEPLHGIPAAVIALAAASSLFLFRLLRKEDIARIDWSTLLLIAGGITVGKLLEASQLISAATDRLSLGELHPMFALFLLCFISALLSALMSNTATAVFLIPIASAFLPEPSTAILIAISASFGMPFVISTPPNAMAYGEGGLRQSDLFVPGLVIMLVGCAIVSVTGRFVLNLAGVP